MFVVAICTRIWSFYNELYNVHDVGQ